MRGANRGWVAGVIHLVAPPMLLLAAGSDALAFGLETHRAVNLRAAQVGMLDRRLKEDLGLPGGLAEIVNGQEAQLWIREGGAAEDEFLGELIGAFVRSRHHFHNPLLPWDQAGLNATSSRCPPFILVGQSSVRWAQNPDQGISGKAAWADARRAFDEALTRPEKSGREGRDQRWADTFRILGQLMHLVADLAVPAHTRNDSHCPKPEGFERWAETRGNLPVVESLIAQPPISPSGSIFAVGVPIEDPVARVPIARLWDTDQYSLELNNPGVTLSPTIGLAEYTNANFFSDDTIFSSAFPSPARSSVELGPPEPEPQRGALRRYFKKTRDGEAVDHLAVPSALYDFLPDALKDRRKGLDDKVFRDYAEKLLPRAVGYSAALVDYFFRGKLELTFTPDPAATNRSLLTAINRSDEPLGPGTLSVHVDNATTGMRETLALLSVPGPVGKDQRLPSLSVDSTLEFSPLTVAYRGTLGLESGAVIGKVQQGAEVEQIFRGAGDWMLRTADGIFPLGLGTAPGQVKWGDRDNTLVARTFLSGGDQRFQGYRINRPQESPGVPLKPNPLDPLQRVVDLIPIGSPVTLSGQSPIDLGTRLSVNRIVDYTQHLGTVHVKYLYAFDPVINNWKVVAKEFLGGSVQIAHQQVLTHGAPSVALTMSHSTTGPQATDSPFSWIPGSFYLNADGDVLVDVVVRVTTRLSTSVPLVRHDFAGTLIGDGRFGFGFVSFATPEPPFHFVVNLTRRTVVAKTCADAIDFEFRDTQGDLLVDLQVTEVRDQTTTGFVGPAVVLGPAGNEPIAFEVAHREGTIQVWSSPGLYRSDFTKRGFWNGTGIMQDVVTGTGVVAFRDPLAVGGNPSLGGAMRQTSFQTDDASRIMVLAELQRSDGPGEGYLALGWQSNLSFEKWTPHRWAPLTGTVSPLAGLTLPTDVNTGASTRGASRGTAMFRTFISRGASFTHLVTERDEVVLTGATGSAVATQYQLLQPNFLFDTSDLRLHRLSPELEVLPAPRPLAPGGPASGEYHVVGRP
jgi:hypothetical protein